MMRGAVDNRPDAGRYINHGAEVSGPPRGAGFTFRDDRGRTRSTVPEGLRRGEVPTNSS